MKIYDSTFPVLSKMTSDLLTPLVSTVASESTFSIASNILGERRTRLSDEMLEVLTCLKDWEDARFRLQKEENEYARTLEKLDKMDLNSEQIYFEINFMLYVYFRFMRCNLFLKMINACD